MSAIVVCDGCGKEPERFADMVRVLAPRRARAGYSLDPVTLEFCSWRCLFATGRRKATDAEPCRPWCVSFVEGQPACDCVDDQPADNFDPWLEAGI